MAHRETTTAMKIVTASLIFGLAFIIAIWIASTAVKYRSKSSETIVVTGLAEKDFVSDLIVWNGSYSRKSLDLKTAYAALKQDENAIRKYLTGKGISDKEMVFSSVEINKEFNLGTGLTTLMSKHFFFKIYKIAFDKFFTEKTI